MGTGWLREAWRRFTPDISERYTETHRTLLHRTTRLGTGCDTTSPLITPDTASYHTGPHQMTRHTSTSHRHLLQCKICKRSQCANKYLRNFGELDCKHCLEIRVVIPPFARDFCLKIAHLQKMQMFLAKIAGGTVFATAIAEVAFEFWALGSVCKISPTSKPPAHHKSV